MSARYKIYPSILDSYKDFLETEEIYDRYWGKSDNPSKSLEEFQSEQFQKMIDKINRVPIPWEDTEKIDRGTVFNEVVDCIINGVNSTEMEIKTNKETRTIEVNYNKRSFSFPISVCREFSDYFKGAQNQIFVSAEMQTSYGLVELYGYVDELTATCVHDIKTTSSYEAWKYKNHVQRLLYPYCLNESGSEVKEFEYNVLLIDEKKYNTFYESFTEHYPYNHEEDSLILKQKVEEFIEFLEENRDLVTNKRIFNEL